MTPDAHPSWAPNKRSLVEGPFIWFSRFCYNLTMSEFTSHHEDDRASFDYTTLTEPDSLFDQYPNDKEMKASAPINESDGAYNRRIAEIEILDKDQEIALAQTIQSGLAAEAQLKQAKSEGASTDLELQQRVDEGRVARDELVTKNLRLAAWMARESMGLPSFAGAEPMKGNITHQLKDLSGGPLEYADRVQIANIAVMKSAGKYTGATGKFSTFVAWQIEADLLRAVGDENSGGRYPEHILSEIRKLNRERRHNADAHSGVPDDAEVANLLDTSEDRLAYLMLLDQSRRVHYVEDLIRFRSAQDIDLDTGEVAEEITLGDVIPMDDATDTTEYEGMQGVAATEVNKTLALLTDRERRILELKYGISTDDPHTLDEIGRVFNVTRERIRQIEGKTYEKLRHPDRSRGLVDFAQLAPTSPVGHLRTEYTADGNTLKTRRSGEGILVPLSDDPDEAHDPWEYDRPEYLVGSELSAEELAEIQEAFDEELMSLNPYLFQKAFVAGRRESYPQTIVDRFESKFGDRLRTEHIESFWNSKLEQFVQNITIFEQEEDMSSDEVGLVFTALLRKTMTDTDVVELQIPAGLDGKIGSIGTGFEHGLIIVNGNVGDNIARGLSDLGQVEVFGNVGRGAGSGMRGYANLIIHGDAGDDLGRESAGQAFIKVEGDAGNRLGYGIKGEAHVEISGHTGDDAGMEMKGQTTLRVGGNAGKNLGKNAEKGSIEITGDVDTINISADFSGDLSIRGRAMRRDANGMWM